MSSGSDPFRLDGRTVILTGASSGLGVQLARALHRQGARLVLAARRTDRLRDLAEELAGAIAVRCDVTVDAECSALVDVAVERTGRVDVLVNNAGGATVAAAEDLAPAAFRQVLELNLVAPFVLARAAGRPMLEQGSGSIVNVASVYGLTGIGLVPNAHYAAAKAGLIGLTRQLSAEWVRRGVRVNAVAPAWFESEMTAELFGDEASQRWLRRNTPMGRAGRPGEVDGAVVFLASEASSYVTGHVLAVDGGWLSG